ncbi:amino acid ABC transporter permease [Kineococcus rhizosphaerae]|uniref:Amino acid ABC transporter membrane protein 2 (PAAT family) n=1 Tax=Kineococcus rhizosphaerae TaxID=559628 RepID=A0A2T0RBG3_9ACTN|nr:amino acid ABC transporter permease [Kineococcus rhizosphaerae]PRY18487.1 amino acid ABC transporter membrane protein 2 (PAAT family) [Kineococcus rhizosphaerae]
MSQVLYDAPGPRARRLNHVLTVVGIALFAAVIGFVVWRLNDAGQFAPSKWSAFAYQDIQRALLGAWWRTMQVALAAIVLSTVLGAVLASLRLSSVGALRWTAYGLIQLFRAPPVLLLMFWFFYGGGGGIPVYWCVVLGLTIYNGAFIAEILRAGVEALPKGQKEAGLAIGLTESQVLWTIQLPQAVRSMLPSLVSQIVVILKDTALAYIIGYSELLRWGQQLGSQYFNLIPAMIVIAVVYVGTNMVIAGIAKVVERRMRGRTSGKVTIATNTAQVGAAGAV